MRRLIVPAVAAALLLAPSLALASQTANGTVKTFDGKAKSLTLDSGQVYYMPSSWKDPGIKAREKVAVTYDTKNGKNMASQVTIQK